MIRWGYHFLPCAPALSHVLGISYNLWGYLGIQTFPMFVWQNIIRCVLHVHVYCVTLFRILVGHDNTPKCMCMLCMTSFCVLMLTVGHGNSICMLCMTLFRILMFRQQHGYAVYDTVSHSNAYCGSWQLNVCVCVRFLGNTRLVTCTFVHVPPRKSPREHQHEASELSQKYWKVRSIYIQIVNNMLPNLVLD